jgi:hypothetical protein
MLDTSFREKEEELQEKLRSTKPLKPLDLPTKKEKSKPKYDYFKYHAKPKNHPDNWKRI